MYYIRDLKLGDFSTPVRTLQLALKKLGYGNFVGTGYFGSATLTAVKSFQVDCGLAPTGIFGKAEYGKMAVKLSAGNSSKIYATALRFLGTDASPNDLAPDELGCADTVSAILQVALGKDMAINYTVSTAQLYRELSQSKAYMRVQEPLPGDILVSPTGYGNGNLSNGHTGIWGEMEGAHRVIMSNNSSKGVFEKNFTDLSWRSRYVANGGFPMATFRKL